MLHKKLILELFAVTLIAATLQFFVPLINAAVSEQCCSSRQMQCCQEEFPSRMICCIAEARHGLDDSAPTQGVVSKTQKAPEGIIVSLSSSEPCLTIPSLEHSEYFLPSKNVTADNHLFKRFFAFLI
ncbi:MAG: hypothetical protein ACE5IY_12840 [bacterium]